MGHYIPLMTGHRDPGRRGRTLAVLTAVLTLPLFVALSPSTAQAATAPVVRFSLAQFDTPGADRPATTAKLNGEYVVVTNYGKVSMVVTGWRLEDRYGHRYTLPAFSLRAGKSVKIHTGRGRNTSTDLYWGRSNYIWNNTRDTATLRSPTGRAIDTCSWTANGPGRTTC